MSAAAATQQKALDLEPASDKKLAKRSKNQQAASPTHAKKHATRSQVRQQQQLVEAEQQQLQEQQLRQVDEHEMKASAEAKAGLNLNLVGAVSGIFGGRSRKTTDTAADGSSRSVEHKEGAGAFKGHGAGTLNAVGEGKADVSERHRKTVEAVDKAEKKKGKKAGKQVQQMDHLGLGQEVQQ